MLNAVLAAREAFTSQGAAPANGPAAAPAGASEAERAVEGLGRHIQASATAALPGEQAALATPCASVAKPEVRQRLQELWAAARKDLLQAEAGGG